MRINAHGHLLPYPSQIPAFMKDKGIFWVEEDLSCMCQGTWRRPVTHPSFFLDRKLEWMDQNRIDREVVLNLSQLYCNGYSRSDTFDVIRFQNDFNGGLSDLYPDRFVSGFVVQPLFLDDALAEIERCVSDYKMPLLCLPSHFLDGDGKWRVVFDPYVDPVFELANHFKLAVEIHPYNAEEMISLEDKFWRFHLVWMCAQTADAWHFYSMGDYGARYPDMRVCFAHGNQFGFAGHGRRKQGYKGRQDLFPGAADPDKTLSQPNYFVDSIVHDVLTFEMIFRRVGAGHIVAGIDDPYPLGEMDTVANSYPGKVIDDAVESGIITTAERDQMWHTNVLNWLYPEHLM